MTGRSFLYHRNIRGKLKESLLSVMPIIGIVLVLCLFVVPLSPGILLTFLSGGALLIIGMMFFTIGSEMSVSPIGAHVGSYMTKSRFPPILKPRLKNIFSRSLRQRSRSMMRRSKACMAASTSWNINVRN